MMKILSVTFLVAGALSTGSWAAENIRLQLVMPCQRDGSPLTPLGLILNNQKPLLNSPFANVESLRDQGTEMYLEGNNLVLRNDDRTLLEAKIVGFDSSCLIDSDSAPTTYDLEVKFPESLLQQARISAGSFSACALVSNDEYHLTQRDIALTGGTRTNPVTIIFNQAAMRRTRAQCEDVRSENDPFEFSSKNR